MNGDVAAQSSGESPGKSIDGKGSPGAEAANGVGHDTELSDTDAEGAPSGSSQARGARRYSRRRSSGTGQDGGRRRKLSLRNRLVRPWALRAFDDSRSPVALAVADRCVGVCELIIN